MMFNRAMVYDITPNSQLAANHTLYKPVEASQKMVTFSVCSAISNGHIRLDRIKLIYNKVLPRENFDFGMLSSLVVKGYPCC